MLNLHITEYGSSGPPVIVLHGGPGAPGSAAGLARGLADEFRVIEPWQRSSGGEPLTVARHVADLHEVVQTLSDGTPPALAGESWGAMLALAYAAAHPENAGPLVLVGCGTFDSAARARMREILDERMSDDLRRRLENLEGECPDSGERLRQQFELIKPLYDYDPIPGEPEEAPPFDHCAHTETWSDMVRLQEQGIYPAAFASITSPALMLHGAFDPHPGRMIRTSLERYIPHMEYHEFERCGHSPWKERKVREEFFAVMKRWLMNKTISGHPFFYFDGISKSKQ
ncbi:MAG: alpha/beta fold hydrolase [Candidatus Latescibacterota bacterium]